MMSKRQYDSLMICEDRRKRNAEASARFRANRKKREEEREAKRKLMATRIAYLEARAKELEAANSELKRRLLGGNL